jgi:hypothetical protein
MIQPYTACSAILLTRWLAMNQDSLLIADVHRTSKYIGRLVTLQFELGSLLIISRVVISITTRILCVTGFSKFSGYSNFSFAVHIGYCHGSTDLQKRY